MGAATYIGRVGGLAVALGVGTAIVTGQGVAFADDGSTGSANSSPAGAGSAGPANPGSGTSPATDSSASTRTNSTQTSSTQTSSTPSTATPSTSTSTTSTKTTTEPTSTSTTSNSVAPGVVVSAQTTTGTSGSTGTTQTPAVPESTPAPIEPTTPAPEPTETVEPTTPAPEPTKAVEPTPTATPEPTANNDSPASSTPTSNPTPPVASVPAAHEAVANEAVANEAVDTGPAALPQNKSVKLAAVTIADVPTGSSTTTVSPLLARASSVTVPPPAAAVAPQNPLTMVVNAVSNVVNWLMGPIAALSPTAPVANPLGWTLLAFVRREFENFVSAVGGTRTTSPTLAPTTLTAETTSLALAAAPLAAAPLAAAAVSAVNVPNFPLPGTQFSPSTSFVNWVTGNYQTGNPLMADTANRFGIWGTDVGVAWDNGMVDDPTTPWNEHQILMAFGDTFSGPNMSGVWRFNTLLRTSDTNLANGIEVPNGEWFNGNMFGGAPLSNPTFARPIINPTTGLPTGVTLIPTAGISVPTPGTRFGVTQYVNFMSVSQWGAAGSWTTDYSGIAYSTDNGENFTIAPSSIRYNQPWGGNQNFQQGAFVRPGDGFVYNYGTPNGRQGAAYVSRVAEKDILDLTKYEYYSKGTAGGWFGIGATPAGWYKNNPAAATPVFGAEGGACGATAAGNTVSEMSVQYNKQLKKYVTLYGDQNNSIVMRTSDTPQGGWSAAKVLMTQQQGGIYAPMMIPSSPSTMGTGSDLYWNLSLYSEYNVMLMKTDLSKV